MVRLRSPQVPDPYVIFGVAVSRAIAGIPGAGNGRSPLVAILLRKLNCSLHLRLKWALALLHQICEDR